MSDIETVESHNRIYKVCGGTFYSEETSDTMVRDIEHFRVTQQRLRFDFGDAVTGRSWGEEHDIEGRVGRSGGQIKIPLLIRQSNSRGGGGLLTGSIVAISNAGLNGMTIYRHPFYKPSHRWDKAKLVPSKYPGYLLDCVIDLSADGERVATPRTNTKDDEHSVVARFKTEQSAHRFLKKKQVHEPFSPINERPLKTNWMKLATEALGLWGWTRIDNPDGFHVFGKPWHETTTFSPEEALTDELNTVAALSGFRNRIFSRYNATENWLEIWQRCPQNTWAPKPWKGDTPIPMSREDVVAKLAILLNSFTPSYSAWRVIRDDPPELRDAEEPKGFVYKRKELSQSILDEALRFAAKHTDTPAMLALPSGGFYGWIYHNSLKEWERFMQDRSGRPDADYSMRMQNKTLSLEFPLPTIRT